MNSTRRLLFAASILVAWVWLPHGAQAHHVVSEYGITAAEPQTLTEASLELRQFDFGDDSVSGTAAVSSVVAQYAPVEWISGSARLPVGSIWYDDGRTETGLADLTLSLRGRFYADRHGKLIVSGGLGTKLPTGEVSKGLGSGHVELVPFLTLSSAPTKNLVFFTTVTHLFAIEGDEQSHHDHEHARDDTHGTEVHGAIIAPHEDTEAGIEVGGAYVFRPMYASVQTNAVFAWSRDDDVFGPLSVTAEIGWRPIEQLRVALAADAPLIPPDRFDWKSRVAAAWVF